MITKLDLLNKNIQKCNKCDLHKLEYNVKDIKKGYGKLYGWKGDPDNNNIKFFFVGMNPSKNRFENIEYAFGGRKFDEGTGIEFVKILNDLDILKDSYVSNLVKCSNYDNTISKSHIYDCSRHIIKEIELVKPQKIITMGKQVKDEFNYLLTFEFQDLYKKYRKNLFDIWHPNYVISYKRDRLQEYIDTIKEICQ